jgi:hypothetical protein
MLFTCEQREQRKSILSELFIAPAVLGKAGAEERQLVGRETPITLLYYYD